MVDGAFRVRLPVTTFHGSKPGRFGSDDAFDLARVEASRPKVNGDQGIHPRHVDALTVKAPTNVAEILAVGLADISKRLAHERERAEMVERSRRFKVLAAFSLQGDLVLQLGIRDAKAVLRCELDAEAFVVLRSENLERSGKGSLTRVAADGACVRPLNTRSLDASSCSHD